MKRQVMFCAGAHLSPEKCCRSDEGPSVSGREAVGGTVGSNEAPRWDKDAQLVAAVFAHQLWLQSAAFLTCEFHLTSEQWSNWDPPWRLH